MKADGRVNRPTTNSAPKISSKMPAAPIGSEGEALLYWLTGKFRYFDVPCCSSSSPAMMRKTLKSCADQERRKFSIAASPIFLSIHQIGRAGKGQRWGKNSPPGN